MEWFLVVYILVVILSLVTVLNSLEDNNWNPTIEETSVGFFIFAYVLEALLVWWAFSTYGGWVPVVVAFAVWKAIGFFWGLAEIIIYGGLRWTAPQTVFGLLVSAGFVFGFASL